MVHFPGFARARLWIQRAVPAFQTGGFPHSEILGSMPVSGSPRLIAGNHVLHRLLAPRHPPYALSSLTIKPAQHTLPAGEARDQQAMVLTQLTLSIYGRRRTIQLSKINFEVSKIVVPDSAPQPADGWSRITSVSNSSSTFDLDALRALLQSSQPASTLKASREVQFVLL